MREPGSPHDPHPGLPASLATAWGVRTRPTKGPRPALTLERIVDAGVAVAAEEGLGAVSMSRVAAALGASTMSLYRHVASKDELVTLMVDTALGPPPPIHSDDGWRAGLTRWADAERAAYQRHPWSLRVPISGPPITPNSIRWMEAGLQALATTDLSEGDKLSVILLLSGFVRHEVMLSADISAATGAGGSELMPSFAAILRSVTTPAEFPAVHALLASGVTDRDDDPDDEYRFGLARILDGIEALVHGGHRPPE